MRKILSIFITILSTSLLNAQTASEFNLIPQPASIQLENGFFNISNKTKILTPNADHQDLASVITEQLHIILKANKAQNPNNKPANVIKLLTSTTQNSNLGNEGYILEINPKEIKIIANKPAGWFYGWQTLAQLIKLNGNTIKALKITDQPKLEWRGLMIDVSRHFFPKPVILRYIDQMAKYKFNVLHFHLTDNQGWRIEIKQLPKLTEVGAWRVPRTGYWKGMPAPEPGEESTYGGFYSQNDIKEIVAYAQKRFVDVVPEIDLPGHSLAFVASYPEISCTKTPQKVLAGDSWNPSRTNVLCVGNDSTYSKLNLIFTEIANLFPSKYIHIGGDEVTRNYWEKCTECQARIKKEGLQNVDELQTYFINRIAKIVRSKGKTPIGWFDNLPGKFDENIAFMSWKDNVGGIKTSNDGHKVIMTPAAYTYLDFYQGDQFLESAIFTVNRLSTSYKFNPLPDGIKAENVLGGQGSLWTEQVPNERKLQFMTWPRGFALIENLWTSPSHKPSWENFLSKTEKHLPLLDQDTVKYSSYFYDAIASAIKNEKGETLIKLEAEVPDLNIYYSFDDTDPDQFYPLYQLQSNLLIPKGAKNIKAVTYRGNKQMGRIIKLPITELERRIKR